MNRELNFGKFAFHDYGKGVMPEIFYQASKVAGDNIKESPHPWIPAQNNTGMTSTVLHVMNVGICYILSLDVLI